MAKAEEKTKLSLATIGRKDDTKYETVQIKSANRFTYTDKEKDVVVVKDAVKFVGIVDGEQMNFIVPFSAIRRMPTSFAGGVTATIGTQIREHKGVEKLFIRSVEFAEASMLTNNSVSKADAIAEL